MPEAAEVYRLGHSQLRVGRTTFATLEGVADSFATVRLTPEQQATFMEKAPTVFVPVTGGPLGAPSLGFQIVEDALAAA